MRRLLLILLLSVSCVAFASQDSLLTEHVIIYADTFKLQDQRATMADAEEQILLDLLHQQAVRLKQRADSIQAAQDSLLRLDPEWVALQDSLAEIARLQREQAIRDSIAREQEELARLKAHQLAAEALHDSISGVETEVKVKALLEDAEEDRQDKLRKLRGYGPWYKEATGLVQFSQNYVSSNWYQGGNSNFAMFMSAKGLLRYDNKQWFSWESTLEWNEGFSTALGDSLRKINMTDDVFKLYSKINIKIKQDRLYGSFTTDFQTSLFQTWKDNTTTLKTGPLTPIRFNWGLGVDYKPIKGLSIVVSPIAYKMVFALDTIHVAPSTYGISTGNQLHTFGSSLRVEWKWKPLREINLETVFYTYTNYKMIELDWEIACDFIINRYLSARVVLHPRYDSSAIADGDTHAKIQFKEFLSIGFAHKFY